MSTIHLPDPHPGRCGNHRTITHSDGFVETLRCLDYEGVVHVCSFPEPRNRRFDRSDWGGLNQASYVTPKPEPWVKP
jgi:hypothetical protein